MRIWDWSFHRAMSSLRSDPGERATQVWLENFRLLHTRFDSIGTINSGRELFDQYLRKRFRGNWIGEPSSVLVRKECFSRLGLFNQNLYQVCDIEMWLRIMFFYDIGFLPEKLSAFRLHPDSMSASNIKSKRNCLDQLQLLESLLSEPEIKSAHPEIEGLRTKELWRFSKNVLAQSPRNFALPADGSSGEASIPAPAQMDIVRRGSYWKEATGFRRL